MKSADISINRRAFLALSATGVASIASAGVLLAVLPRRASASARMPMAMNMPMSMPMRADVDAPMQQAGANAGVVDMQGEYYKPVHLLAKPNAVAQLTPKQIEEFERTIACPCPCTLDVFTCRTTDFSCGNSPAVHADVQQLVSGGYSADEIMKALTGTYGDAILMAPPKSGINLVGWFAPFAALGTGAVMIAMMLRTWRKNALVAATVAANNAATRLPDVGATEEELARLRAALRDDSR